MATPYVSVQSIFGAPQFTGLYKATENGLPPVFPGNPGYPTDDGGATKATGFWAVDGSAFVKNSGTFDREYGERGVAKLGAYGAASVATTTRPVEAVPCIVASCSMSRKFNLDEFRGLINPREANGSNLKIDTNGLMEIKRQLGNGKKQVDNLKYCMLTSMLTGGVTYQDRYGTFLPTSSGAFTPATIQYGVPAGNQGLLSPTDPEPPGNAIPLISGQSVIIDTLWTNTQADIEQQILLLRKVAERQSGMQLKYAFYGLQVFRALTGNSKFLNYDIRNTKDNDEFTRRLEIANPFLGLTWVPGYQAYFRDNNGNIQDLFPSNMVVFTPEPSPNWIGWKNGTKSVFSDMKGIFHPNVAAELSSIVEAEGDFAYCTVESDPISIKPIFGFNTLPVLKVPWAIYQASVL